MKINLGGFSGEFHAFKFKAETVCVEVDFYEVLAAFLNSELPIGVRKKAEEALETYADEACPLDPQYNTWLAVDKTQAYEDLYPESEADSSLDLEPESQILYPEAEADSVPCPGLQIETKCNAPGFETDNESASDSEAYPIKPSLVWENYKASVLASALEQTLAQCTTKAALKAADNRIKDLRKCLSIGLSPKFDEDFLEQMYLAKSKIYKELPDNFLPEFEADSIPCPELQIETKCNTPGDSKQSMESFDDSIPAENNALERNPVPVIYVLKENQNLIPKGEEPGSYAIVDSVLSIPSKTCQYLDENGELGEAVYAMAQARKDIRDGKQAVKKATEDENKAALEARLKAIDDNPDYSPEEKANRSRNARARYGITDFSKV